MSRQKISGDQHILHIELNAIDDSPRNCSVSATAAVTKFLLRISSRQIVNERFKSIPYAGKKLSDKGDPVDEKKHQTEHV